MSFKSSSLVVPFLTDLTRESVDASMLGEMIIPTLFTFKYSVTKLASKAVPFMARHVFIEVVQVVEALPANEAGTSILPRMVLHMHLQSALG